MTRSAPRDRPSGPAGPTGPAAVPAGPPAIAGMEAHVVPAFRARGPYVCPGCGADVVAGTGHVVAWPEGRTEERRHWHRHCWRLAARRGRLA